MHAEAEFWYAALDGENFGHWTYFRRSVSAQLNEAERRVEWNFRQWLVGRLEAEGSVE